MTDESCVPSSMPAPPSSAKTSRSCQHNVTTYWLRFIMDEASSEPSPKRSSSTKERVKSFGCGTKKKGRPRTYCILTNILWLLRKKPPGVARLRSIRGIRHDPRSSIHLNWFLRSQVSQLYCWRFLERCQDHCSPARCCKEALAASKAAIKDRPYLS